MFERLAVALEGSFVAAAAHPVLDVLAGIAALRWAIGDLYPNRAPSPGRGGAGLTCWRYAGSLAPS
jgi:hypothetical protein